MLLGLLLSSHLYRSFSLLSRGSGRFRPVNSLGTFPNYLSPPLSPTSPSETAFQQSSFGSYTGSCLHCFKNYHDSAIMAKKSKGFKVYAVAKGRVPGIYSTWGECEAQTSGFSGAIFKSFSTHGEAQSFINTHSSLSSHSSFSSRSSSYASNSRFGATTGLGATRQNHGSVDGNSNQSSRDEVFLGHGVNELSCKKFYAVASGHRPGVYATWAECQAQTKGYSRAIYKSFKSVDEAVSFVKSRSASNSNGTSTDTNDVQSGRKRSREESLDQTQPKKSPIGSQLQIIIHFDGGSRGNPGVAGSGAEVVVVDGNDTSTTHLIREYCGNSATNNYAEYKGLIAGLIKAKACVSDHQKASSSSKPLVEVHIYGDSNLIIQQLKGSWQCKNENIIPLFKRCKQLIKEIESLDSRSSISYEHVYREQNKVADALANEAMDQRRSWTTSSSTAAKENNDDGDPSSTFSPSISHATSKAKARGGGKAAVPVKEVIEIDDDDDSCVSC